MRTTDLGSEVEWLENLSWVPVGNSTDESTDQTSVQQSSRFDLQAVDIVQNFRIVSSSEDNPYVCTNCHKRYRWKDSLRRHQRVECGLEPQHACPVCGRLFKHKHQLVVHSRKHHMPS